MTGARRPWPLLALSVLAISCTHTVQPPPLSVPVVAALNHRMKNNVEGLGGWPSVGHTGDLVDIGELAHRYAEAADIELTGNDYAETDWGDIDDFQVVWATGDLRLGAGVTGAGVLVVDGDLACPDGFLWFGPVIIRGDLTLGSGVGNVHVFGTILVEGGEGPQTISGNADVLYSSETIQRVNALNGAGHREPDLGVAVTMLVRNEPY